MDGPWHALRLCDFCGSNAVVIAPKVGGSEFDVTRVPACTGHTGSGTWGPDTWGQSAFSSTARLLLVSR
jgi:hypothetical protein